MRSSGPRRVSRALTTSLLALLPLAACFKGSSGGSGGPEVGDSSGGTPFDSSTGDDGPAADTGAADTTVDSGAVDSSTGADTSIGADTSTAADTSTSPDTGDDGSTTADAPPDTGVTCGTPSYTSSTDPDAGMYTSYGSVTCTTSTSITLSCTCTEDSVDTCFCGEGNAAPGCVTGSLADCGYVPTCGADMRADPLNCGRCGHSCDGLPCSAGICAGPQLGFGATYFYPSAWMGDGTNIYASSCTGSGLVISLPIAGLGTSGTPTTISSGNGEYAMAMDATHVYFLGDSAGTVWSAPISGGAATKLGTFGVTWSSWGAACGSLHSLALDASTLYWAVQGSSGNGFVYSMAKSGGPINVLTSDSLVQNGTIAIDASNVYFLAWDSMSNGYVKSVPKNVVGDAGVASTIVASFPGQEMLDMVLVGTTLYVVGSSAVYTVPVTGGTPAVWWGNHLYMSPQHVASDGTNLYIDDFVNGWIYVKPLAGGYAQRVAAEYEADKVMLDSKNVYWTSYTYGGFWSAPLTYRP